jgi:hypothetical protein
MEWSSLRTMLGHRYSLSLAFCHLPFELTRRLVENVLLAASGEDTIFENALPLNSLSCVSSCLLKIRQGG